MMFRPCVLVISALLLLFMGISAQHRALLQSAAQIWLVHDTIQQPADAVAIFGGGIDTRPLAAAGYFRHGLAKRILVSNVDSGTGPQSSHTQDNVAELKKLGVPDDAIEISTSCDARTGRELVKADSQGDR
jgi:hypothetical protein